MNKIKLTDLGLSVSGSVDNTKYIILVDKESLETPTSLFYLVNRREMEVQTTVSLFSADVKDGGIKPIFLKDSNGNEHIPMAVLYNKLLHESKYLEVDISN